MKRLIQIPVLRDNYNYLAISDDGSALVVDPSDPDPILTWLADHPEVKLQAVINTHHHFDHVGGNEKLKEATGCEVVGPAHDAERIPGITRKVSPDETIQVAGFELLVLDVRAHTKGHIAYKTSAAFDEVIRHGHEGEATAVERLAARPALFVGDSLFMGGCGRLFEGTPAELAESMKVLSAQPQEALVCCAHEYTASNLKFAVQALPEVAAIKTRLDLLEVEKGKAQSSVPDVLALEMETNPFLLGLLGPIASAYSQRHHLPDAEPATVLGAMRAAKDEF